MKKIINIAEKIILILGIVFCVFMVLQKTICKNTGVFGLYAYVIVTDSMEPKINVGDVILVKKTNPNKIKVGDTVSYLGTEKSFKNKIIAHEVKEIGTEDGKKIFYTKGINNSNMDPAVYENQLYGKMLYKFIVISFLSQLIRSPYGFFIVIFIPLLIIFAYELVNVIRNIKKAKKGDLDETKTLKLPKLKPVTYDTVVLELPKLK